MQVGTRKEQSRNISRTGRWAAAVLLAFASLLAPLSASAALADIGAGDSVWIGPHVGYPGTTLFPVYLEIPADIDDPGEPDYWAYCLENRVSAEVRTTGVVGDLGTFLGQNNFTDPAIQRKILWILGHSYPALSLTAFAQAAGLPSITQNNAIEATQYAIWNLTELAGDPAQNWQWDAGNVETETAYRYLATGAVTGSMNPGDFGGAVSITPPAGSNTSNSLVGPFTVNTDSAPAKVSADPSASLTDETGAAIDTDAVTDGQRLYIDRRNDERAGSATVNASVRSAAGTGMVVSVPKTPGAVPSASDHAQSIILVAPDTHRVSAAAAASWSGASIGTTLLDQADHDHVIPSAGGTVVDTVEYRDLIPGRAYRLAGELMRKSDGSGTGIVGSTAFTPSQPDGSAEVEFTVPKGYAGESLVAFEYLTVAGDDEIVAEHADIDAAAQTVSVAQVQTAEKPEKETPENRPDGGDRLADTGGAAPPVALLILAAAGMAAGAGLLRASARAKR